MIKFFGVSADDIERLDQFTLPALMKKILRTELTILRLKQSELTLSLNINDPDGGLDAFLGIDVPNDHPWLPEGKSGWQFKASTFSITDASKEVLTAKKTLKPRIKKLLDNNETYVLVIGGKDYVPTDLEARKNAIEEEFKNQGYPLAKVKVFSSGQIADWSSSLPSVIASLKQGADIFKDFSEWQKLIGLKPFVAGGERTKIIDNVRDAIQKNQNAVRTTIIRLVGLSGVGKTRLAYECLNIDYLKEIVLYLESPDGLNSGLNWISRNVETKLILVIDECTHEKFVQLAREAESIGGRFTLITLDRDIDNPRDAKDFHRILNPLDKTSSEELIKKTVPGLPENARIKIVEFSEGFPEILIMLGENFAFHPDILSASTLNAIGVNEVLDRIIVGRSLGPFFVPAVRKVLTALSLFKRIGWDDDLAVQGRKVCELLNIDWTDAREIVANQENRKLVARAGRYRYVTPLPLAINLSSTWLQAMDTSSIQDFFDKLGNPEVQRAFQERLAESGYTSYSKNMIQSFLSKFNYDTLNSSHGSEIFLNLSKADHSFSMYILNQIFSDRSIDDLLKFKAGRRNVIWALQKIAWWKDTFADSSKLLLRLAVAENEEWSNNATGAFIALFQTYLGGTEVPIWERFSVLDDALVVGDEATKKIVLKAIGASLQFTHAIRSGGAEEQGTVVPPPEWNPRVVSDIKHAVSSAFALIDKAFRLPQHEIQLLAARLILDNSRELVFVGFSKEYLERLCFIQKTFPELEDEVIRNIETIIYFDGKQMPSSILTEIERFRDNIVNDSYHSLLVRYVKANVFEDQLDDRDKALHNKIRELAATAISSPEKLDKELPWLMETQGIQTYLFGKTLGEFDIENKWLKRLLDLKGSISQGSLLFFSGYLSALKSRDTELYREVLIAWSNDEQIQAKFTLELIWRSGSSDWDAQFILNMLKEHKIRPDEIQVLTYGAWFRNVNQEIFADFLKEFNNLSDEGSASAILGIMDQFIESNESFIMKEKEVILDILQKTYRHKDAMEEHYWNKLVKKLTERIPDAGPILVELALKQLSGNYHIDEELKKYMRQALKSNPQGTWLKIKEVLNSDTMASWRMVELIRGGISFGDNNSVSLFSLLPEEELRQWLNENPNNAPLLIARMIPLREAEPKLHPMARELILKYSSVPKIRKALLDNWYTEGYIGKESDHLKYKLSVIETWAKDDESVISSWAKEEEIRIRARIKQRELIEAERNKSITF
ncbi:MAG: hypothetical protein ACFCUE_15440 [Candidatus Bathyarchaeia archaeon]|jgi:hypothetical protein